MIILDMQDTLEQVLTDIRATEKQVTLAAMRALNKTARWLRTQAVREISAQQQIPQKLIRERLNILKANRRDLKAFIHTKLSSIPANKLGRLRQTPTGARAGKLMFTGAFVATMPSGKRSVFKRKGRARLPIQEIKLSIRPTATAVIENILDYKTAARFEVLLRHELQFILK